MIINFQLTDLWMSTAWSWPRGRARGRRSRRGRCRRSGGPLWSSCRWFIGVARIKFGRKFDLFSVQETFLTFVLCFAIARSNQNKTSESFSCFGDGFTGFTLAALHTEAEMAGRSWLRELSSISKWLIATSKFYSIYGLCCILHVVFVLNKNNLGLTSF